MQFSVMQIQRMCQTFFSNTKTIQLLHMQRINLKKCSRLQMSGASERLIDFIQRDRVLINRSLSKRSANPWL